MSWGWAGRRWILLRVGELFYSDPIHQKRKGEKWICVSTRNSILFLPPQEGGVMSLRDMSKL
jgi:hypothetical protein